MNNYIKKLRQNLGHQKFIHPGARIIIENDLGQILFIQRLDNGNLGIPAGAFEENETIEECIIREVNEEVGLEILELELIGVSSDPINESVKYPNGDMIQYFTCEFYSNIFQGQIEVDNDEVKTAQFLDYEKYKDLPKNEQRAFESLVFFRKNGRVRVS